MGKTSFGNKFIRVRMFYADWMWGDICSNAWKKQFLKPSGSGEADQLAEI